MHRLTIIPRSLRFMLVIHASASRSLLRAGGSISGWIHIYPLRLIRQDTSLESLGSSKKTVQHPCPLAGRTRAVARYPHAKRWIRYSRLCQPNCEERNPDHFPTRKRLPSTHTHAPSYSLTPCTRLPLEVRTSSSSPTAHVPSLRSLPGCYNAQGASRPRTVAGHGTHQTPQTARIAKKHNAMPKHKKKKKKKQLPSRRR